MERTGSMASDTEADSDMASDILAARKHGACTRLAHFFMMIPQYSTLQYLPSYAKKHCGDSYVAVVIWTPFVIVAQAIVFVLWIVKRWLIILANLVPTARHVTAVVVRLLMAGKISVLLYVSAILLACYADEATDLLILIDWSKQARAGGYFVVGLLGFIMPIGLTLSVMHNRTRRGLTEDRTFAVVCEIELLQEAVKELEKAVETLDNVENLGDNDGDEEEDPVVLMTVPQPPPFPRKKIMIPKMELLKLLEATESVVMAHLQSMTLLRLMRAENLSIGDVFVNYWFEFLSLTTSILSVGFAVGTVRAQADVPPGETGSSGKTVRLAALTLLASAETLLRLGTLITWKQILLGICVMFAFP